MAADDDQAGGLRGGAQVAGRVARGRQQLDLHPGEALRVRAQTGRGERGDLGGGGDAVVHHLEAGPAPGGLAAEEQAREAAAAA